MQPCSWAGGCAQEAFGTNLLCAYHEKLDRRLITQSFEQLETKRKREAEIDARWRRALEAADG